MKRKSFLNTLLPIMALPVVGPAKQLANWPEEGNCKRPPYLKRGDTIGICCVAGNISLEEIQPAVSKIREWGFSIKIGETIGKKDFTFGGTDEERLSDFQNMLDDDSVQAILCARGGYGAVRIIDRINFRKFKRRPKWVIGFSDVTVLHGHIHQELNIATLHSKMCNSFPKNWSEAEPVQQQTIESIRDCLTGTLMSYQAIPNPQNKLGKATGILVGGNLKTIESLAGSASDIKTDGKILFVEDAGEYLYSIDRMFWNLKRSGKLERLSGLIIGGFSIKKEERPEDVFGLNLIQIVLEKIQEYDYPVCFDFPVGHQKNNFALKCGVPHILQVTAESMYLNEVS